MKGTSIKLLIIACLATSLASCDNDEVAPVDETENTLVTRISRDGITQLELFYDIGKKLYRVDFYFGGIFSSYNLYEYSENGLKELRRYNADDHSLDYRTVFTLDNFGRVVKGENYSSPDFDEIASISEFDYNTSGQLISRKFRSSGQPVYYLEEYAYDDQNNLITLQRTLYPNQPGEYLHYRYDYSPGSQSIPGHWENYVFILGVSGLDDGIRDMFNTNTFFKSWDSDQELTSELSFEASGHEFNGDGNLTRQVLTRKNILNPENADIVSEMTYEYAQ